LGKRWIQAGKVIMSSRYVIEVLEGIPATLAEKVSSLHAYAILHSEKPEFSAELKNLTEKDRTGSSHRHKAEKPQAPDRS
jgi:hypothetical protein